MRGERSGDVVTCGLEDPAAGVVDSGSWEQGVLPVVREEKWGGEGEGKVLCKEWSVFPVGRCEYLSWSGGRWCENPWGDFCVCVCVCVCSPLSHRLYPTQDLSLTPTDSPPLHSASSAPPSSAVSSPLTPADSAPLTTHLSNSSVTRIPSFITSPQVGPGEDNDGSLFTDAQARVEETLIDRGEINKFLANICGCKLNCPNKLGREAIEERRGNSAELSKQELDMAILGQLAAFDQTVGRVQQQA